MDHLNIFHITRLRAHSASSRLKMAVFFRPRPRRASLLLGSVWRPTVAVTSRWSLRWAFTASAPAQHHLHNEANRTLTAVDRVDTDRFTLGDRLHPLHQQYGCPLLLRVAGPRLSRGHSLSFAAAVVCEACCLLWLVRASRHTTCYLPSATGHRRLRYTHDATL